MTRHYPVVIEYADGKYDGAAQDYGGWCHINVYSKMLKSGEPSNQYGHGQITDKYKITLEDLDAIGRGESILVNFGGQSYPVRPDSYYKQGDGLTQGDLFGEGERISVVD